MLNLILKPIKKEGKEEKSATLGLNSTNLSTNTNFLLSERSFHNTDERL